MKKIFNIEKAIDQFVYRLQHGKYEPNQSDVEALNFIVDWINREKEKNLKENTLFAKMFIHVFTQEVNYYKGDFKLSQKKIADYLEMPIEQHYEMFTKSINDLAMNNYTEILGLSNNHPKTLTDEEILFKEKVIKENQTEMLKYLNGVFEEEPTRKSLNNTITEFINRFKNKQ
jgi:hypothetical protein